MSNKITDRDYLYLSAMLSAREPKLLTESRARRMIDAAGFDEAAKVLVECGYEDMSGMNAARVEEVLSRRRADIFSEIQKYAPEKGLVDVFRLRYDYHNAKVLLKAEGVGADGARLLSAAGRIAPEKLTEYYRAEDFRELSAPFGEAIREARAVLAKTENPQQSDFILDRACFAEMHGLAAKLSSPFLLSYTALLSDSANLRSAVRTRRMGRGGDFLLRAAVPGGSIGADALAAQCTSGGDFAPLYEGTFLQEAAEEGDAAAQGGSLAEFEKSCDNALMGFLKEAKRSAFGAETAVAYLAAVESEIIAVRMILTGRLAGVKSEMLRERLRDCYA